MNARRVRAAVAAVAVLGAPVLIATPASAAARKASSRPSPSASIFPYLLSTTTSAPCSMAATIPPSSSILAMYRAASFSMRAVSDSMA